MKLPAIRTIGLQQNVCQLILSDWTLDQPAKAEAKRSLMIGRDLNLDLDCLSFSICLGNKRWIISVFTRVDVLGIFNVVRITTNSTLAFVLLPLHAETSAVQLIICELLWALGKLSPGRIPARRIFHIAVPKNRRDHVSNYQKSDDIS